MVLSIEGYIFIKFPLRYEEIVTEEKTAAGVLTAWAVAAVVASLMAAHASMITESQPPAKLLTASYWYITSLCRPYLQWYHSILLYNHLLRSPKPKAPPKIWAITRRTGPSTEEKQKGSEHPGNHYNGSSLLLPTCNHSFGRSTFFRYPVGASCVAHSLIVVLHVWFDEFPPSPTHLLLAF